MRRAGALESPTGTSQRQALRTRPPFHFVFFACARWCTASLGIVGADLAPHVFILTGQLQPGVTETAPSG